MAITILENDQGYAPNLKFKDLLKKDYLIVSKKFDQPLEFSSKFCPNTNGKSYKFSLDLHEYSQMDPDTEERTIYTDKMLITKTDGKKELVDIGEVARWEADNEYEGKNGEWVQTQGTILKALNNAAVDEKLKITMVDGKNGKKVYNVESLGVSETPSTPAPKKSSPTASEPATMDTKISAMKLAGLSLEEVLPKLKEEFGAPEAVIKTRWEAL